MASGAATTPLDFSSLLSKNYRPARVSRLIPQEAYKDEEAGDKARRKKEAPTDEELAAKRDAEASKLVIQLVSKTPAYINHNKAVKQQQSVDNNDDEDIEEIVAGDLPVAPTHEWETLPSSLHAVELDDWEKRIEWDGVKEEEPGVSNKEPMDAVSLLQQRRNPYLDALVFDETNISWEGTPEDTREMARKVKLILEVGTAGQSVARSVIATSRPAPFGQSEEYARRYEREWSTPATSSAELPKGALHADRDQMESFIEARQKKREQMAIDKSIRVTEAMGTLSLGGGKGRTITSSLMGPGGTERTGRPARQSSSSHDVEYVEQLELINNHALVKPDLSRVELRQYHRPRLPLSVVRTDLPWQFQVRHVPSAKKAESSTYTSSYQSMMGTHAGALSQSKIRNDADLSPTEGNLVLLEYCEERPPIQLTKGMASKIINYYRGDKARCPVSTGGGDRPARRNRRDNVGVAGASTVAQTNKGERSTRLVGPNDAAQTTVSDWIGKPPQKTREERSEKSIDILPEGVTEILHHKFHGPFLGEIEEGVTQTGLISNMLVAPMFAHEPESTDFLMILGKKPSGGSRLDEPPQALPVVLRPMPTSVFTVGQTEPCTRVYAPNTTGEKSFIAPFLSYQIAKALTRTENAEGHGLRFDEISDYVFPNTGSITGPLRQRLKQVALYDKNTQIWSVKPIGMDDYPGLEGLGRRFTPEGVAAYETACAAARRLCDLGLHELFSGTSSVASVGVAMAYLSGQVNALRELSRKMRKMLDIAKSGKSKKTSEIALYELASDKLETDWKEARRKYEVAKFIYEELQLAPWHSTQEFLEVHKGAQGTGMMKLTGLGDPSGQGEGFNFLREEAKPAKASGTTTDGALNAQIKKITGTENDLRKLTMKQMASLLRSYGMGQKEIDILKRWDRVHVIRDLSTKAASDGMGDGLERFARGEKMKLSEQKQMYRDRIQEIWCRQRAALSSDPGDSRVPGGAPSEVADSVDAEAKADAPDAQKPNRDSEKDKDESDSESDDDDLAAMLEEDMMDVRETNQLVRGIAGGNERNKASLDFSKDARALAALMRERDAERAAKEGLLASGGPAPTEETRRAEHEQSMKGRKVIRKRITKTHPDGIQTITFKFVIVPAEVDKIIARKREEGETEKEPTRKKKEPRSAQRPLGHAMFEEDDDHKGSRGIKLQVERRAVRGRAGMTARTKKPKLQLGKLKQKATQEKRNQKRKREAEEADLYVVPSKRLSTTNSRKERVSSSRSQKPHVILADQLEAIRSGIERRPHSGPFHKPVNRRALPRYYEVISNPIDLQTIRDKIQKYDYKTVDALLKDFELMKNNAVRFNGPTSFLAVEANAIYESVKAEIADKRQSLSAMEDAVREMGTKKKKARKNARSPKSSGGGSSANVVVDGVPVNLGELPPGFAFDFSDSDDS